MASLCAIAVGAVWAAPALSQSYISQSSKQKQSSFANTKGPSVSVKKPEKGQQLYLTGDELVYDTKNNRVVARGNIEIYYGAYSLTADEVIYDRSAGTLTARGNVVLKDSDGTVSRGDRMDLTEDFSDAFVESLSVVTSDESRISARRAIRREGNVTEFQEAKYSPCKSDPGKPPLWCIGATTIIHDKAAQTISYQDAQFELFGMPVLWMPYFQHPDPTVKRRSGFLTPEIGSSSDLGFTAEIPYFYNLAPNYDFTFHPMFTAKQGVLWQGDWRHRLSFGDVTGVYEVKLAGIGQSDTPEVSNKALSDTWRGSVETHGRFSLSSWWKFGWDVVVESDDTFRRFYKLDSILQTDRVNSAFVTGISDRNYFGAYIYQFGGLFLQKDTPIAESRVHPVIDYNYVFANPVLGGELKFDFNALSFSRSLTYTAPSSVTRNVESSITRATADVSWRRRLIDPLGQTYTPFADLRGDVYQFSDVVDPITKEITSNDGAVRGVASAGLLYSYPFIASVGGASHVIEPIGQIIARQKSVDQRRLPDEDARSLVFDDTNLFDLDKNSGYDRVETGTRANVGLQYTYQSVQGLFARFLVGQSFHLAGDNIYSNPGKDANGLNLYSPSSGLETARSDYVLGAYVSPSPFFRTVAQARFDESTLALRRSDVFAQANYGPFVAQTTYAFTAHDPSFNTTKDQQDIIGLLGMRITDRWSVIGQARYDLDSGQRIQDIFQLRYADECFVLTTTYTETLVSIPQSDLQPDRSVMLRFELKNLGDFKYKTDVFDKVLNPVNTVSGTP